MKRRILFLSILVSMSIFAARAQSPLPVIVPAATPVGNAPAAAVPGTQESETLQGTIKILQEMKAANEEMLKKQEATLLQLDELEKAAEQLKIFSKRG